VVAALCGPSTPGRATQALSAKLFDQLDINSDHSISFKVRLAAAGGWLLLARLCWVGCPAGV
jgi:hypothetical protein